MEFKDTLGVLRYTWSPKVHLESKDTLGVQRYTWSPKIHLESKDTLGVLRYTWGLENEMVDLLMSPHLTVQLLLQAHRFRTYRCWWLSLNY
ncbi:hypothetical protein DPMN_166626 [Dreissena polymorpha]|uniref:Uncharacterized protein n=1 Tax=Dreissena polymorpha TaxID=45954 RepID=A0A9D4IXS1_DREPO|nr:hypothetical protein DPMN_166626 [Dreissena polymorpha]